MNDAQIIADLEGILSEQETPDGFYSVREICRSGRSRKWVMRRLDAAKVAGRLEVRWVKREGVHGEPRSVPVYRILPAEISDQKQGEAGPGT